MTRSFPQPFIVLATDNPIEYEGTYELPEAQLDRFPMRLRLGYLTPGRAAMLQRRLDRAGENVELNRSSARRAARHAGRSNRWRSAPDLLDYVVAIVGATRHHPQVEVGASPRAAWPWSSSLAARRCWSARLCDPRRHQADGGANPGAPGHPATGLWVRQVTSDDVIAGVLSTVPTPKTDPARAVTG